MSTDQPATAPSTPSVSAPLCTVHLRVQAFLDAHGAIEGEREDIARIATTGTDLKLTLTDLRALHMLASLGHHVLEELYMETDDDGELSPSLSGPKLIESITEWRAAERAWTWHPAQALAAQRAHEAEASPR